MKFIKKIQIISKNNKKVVHQEQKEIDINDEFNNNTELLEAIDYMRKVINSEETKPTQKQIKDYITQFLYIDNFINNREKNDYETALCFYVYDKLKDLGGTDD